MIIRLHKSLVLALLEDAPQILTKLGIVQKDDELQYVSWLEVPMDLIPDEDLTAAHKALSAHVAIRGVKMAMFDIDRWLHAKKNPSEILQMRVRTMKQFEDLLLRTMLVTPGPRIYEQTSEFAYDAYYVAKVEYHPKRQTSGGGTVDEHVEMDLVYRRFGQQHDATHTFWPAATLRRTVVEALGEAGYVLETAYLRETYEKWHRRYEEVHDRVGTQFWVTGMAVADRDDVMEVNDYWNRRGSDMPVAIGHGADFSKCVVDVYSEKDQDAGATANRDRYFNAHFWEYYREQLRRNSEAKKKGKTFKSATKRNGHLYNEDADAVDTAWGLTPEQLEGKQQITAESIPVHPAVCIFSLHLHKRFSVHVGQLKDYVYDTKLGEKLVLPDETRNLVDLLLAQERGTFADIVRGKGAGAVVLCAGPPGVGKTLTAEVYTEVVKRPLYSIQCAQLGIKPDDLENHLLVAFNRAQRWNAILLLDEADVYVCARGSNLIQNAIVGVFLRVLEYYQGVMFMTTNRADSVDDAIASRCVARIEYSIPDQQQQARIWRILADTTGAKLTDAELKKIVTAFPELSGRDVKNLLKLAILVNKEAPITCKTIEFVRQFKPTVDAAKYARQNTDAKAHS